MTFLVVAAWAPEERDSRLPLRLVVFARFVVLVGRSGDLGVCAGGIGVLTVDDPLAGWGTPDRSHAGARRIVKAPTVVDGQPRPGADGLVDDQLDPVGVELIGTPVVQRRGDPLKRMLDLDLSLHC
jgi:hypothetical protein